MGEYNKHSPGPWSFEATCFDRRIAIRGGTTAYGRPFNVALVNRPGSARSGEDKANARLIAAAPELLDVLKRLLPAIEGQVSLAQSAHGREVRLWEPASWLVEKARAAIAKAEGQA